MSRRVLITFCTAVWLGVAHQASTGLGASSDSRTADAASPVRIPAVFVANAGQFDRGVRFYSRGARHAVSRHIGAREHRDDAGRGARGRRVNPADGRVRVRGADQRAGKRAGELDVGHETPAAGEKALIFDAPQRSADTLIVGTASLGHGG